MLRIDFLSARGASSIPSNQSNNKPVSADRGNVGQEQPAPFQLPSIADVLKGVGATAVEYVGLNQASHDMLFQINARGSPQQSRLVKSKTTFPLPEIAGYQPWHVSRVSFFRGVSKQKLIVTDLHSFLLMNSDISNQSLINTIVTSMSRFTSLHQLSSQHRPRSLRSMNTER